MRTHHELQQEIRADYEEKLGALRAYIRELKERADTHDAEDEHYQTDLMRAENDAGYYEAELRAMGAAPPRAVPGPRPSVALGAAPAAGEALPLGLMLVGAVAVGAFLGRLLAPRRL